ncbi:MAG: amidase family protein, partial [bacterium]
EPVPDYQAALTGTIQGLKIGIVKEMLYADVVEEEIRQSVLDAIATLKNLGAEVVELSIPLAANAGAINGAIR